MSTFNIGKLACHLIINTELSNSEILKRIQTVFPEAKTTASCIAWYKSDLRKKGQLVDKKPKNSVALTPEQLAELMK